MIELGQRAVDVKLQSVIDFELEPFSVIADDFSKLNAIRNNSAHLRHDLDGDARTPALEAICLLEKIDPFPSRPCWSGRAWRAR